MSRVRSGNKGVAGQVLRRRRCGSGAGTGVMEWDNGWNKKKQEMPAEEA